MVLLVTAVAFVAVKFRRLWFRARDHHEKEREKERDSVPLPDTLDLKSGEKEVQKIDATDKKVNI